MTYEKWESSVLATFRLSEILDLLEFMIGDSKIDIYVTGTDLFVAKIVLSRFPQCLNIFSSS